MEEQKPLTISNNTFTGIHWDATAIEGINNVAKALLNLTELYRSQYIEFTLLKVTTPENDVAFGVDEKQANGDIFNK